MQRPDERSYLLVVDNGSGVLRAAARLAIRDPVSMVTVLALSISLLVIIVICCACTVAMRRRHVCCFGKKQHFHQHDNIRQVSPLLLIEINHFLCSLYCPSPNSFQSVPRIEMMSHMS